MLWTVAALLALVLLWYALSGRAWLKTKPWAQGFFAWIEPIEIALYRKSETLLIGRLLWFGGFVVTAYDALALFASSLDLTPLTARLLANVPEDMRGLVLSASFALIGLAISWLRKRVTKPLEIVAIADKDVTPKVAEAIAMADATKDEAVAVVTEAKGVA
ncbi:hypothetical protein [uncultured Bradyrhizobium sp.]|uniref:hypothetical protein n=1 Tax=uncultured Bradyrhizobium sp. TaxID=199684 RepID=UPI0035CBF0B3